MNLNLASFQKEFKIGAVLIAILIISFVAYLFYNDYRLSRLPRVPITNLGIVEDPQLRKSPVKVRAIIKKENNVKKGKTTVFESLNITQLNQEKAGKIAKRFGFSGKPFSPGGTLIWYGDGENFMVGVQSQTVSLAVDATKEPLVPISDFPDNKKISQQLKDILKEIGLPESAIDFENPAVQYSTATGVGGPTKTNVARLKELEYSPKMGNIDIFSQEAKPLVSSIQIGNKGKLLGFSIPWAPYSWRALGEYPLKSIDEAVKEIKNGGGKIVQLATIKTGNKTQGNKNILSITLTDASLGYYSVVKEKAYLTPVYILTGRAILASDGLSDITIYVSAIPDRFFLKR